MMKTRGLLPYSFEGEREQAEAAGPAAPLAGTEIGAVLDEALATKHKETVAAERRAREQELAAFIEDFLAEQLAAEIGRDARDPEVLKLHADEARKFIVW